LLKEEKKSNVFVAICDLDPHSHPYSTFKEKTMANFNLGPLRLNKPPRSEDGTLERSGSGIRTDTYAFTTGFINSNVAISSTSFSNENIALVLFKDNNKDGILNNGDNVAPGGNAGSGGIFQSLNVNAPQGSYIARLTSAFDTDYNISLRRTSISAANPFTNKEIQLGTIAQDLQRSNRVNDADTADNFAFTLDGSSSLNIGVRELGNKKGDVNIRVVQDLNSNGSVDENEVVVKGISTRNGNVDTITGLNKAGDYILQVCQTNGDSRFGVNFDHSAA